MVLIYLRLPPKIWLIVIGFPVVVLLVVLITFVGRYWFSMHPCMSLRNDKYNIIAL